MHITRVYIDGFKRLVNFHLVLNDKLNVIVGDNETGKTSVLEAINLVLTRQYDGRIIDHTLDPYLFNIDAVEDYFSKLRAGLNAHPPRIVIEAYISEEVYSPQISSQHEASARAIQHFTTSQKASSSIQTRLRNSPLSASVSRASA